MAENYKVGENYYLPVKVYEIMDGAYAYPIRFEFGKGNGCNTNAIENEPNLLLTASEIAANFHYRKNIEKEERLAALEKENTDLKEQVKLLKAEAKDWRSKYMGAKANRDDYKRAADHLKAECDRTNNELALMKVINFTLAEKIEDLKGGKLSE